MLLVLLLIFLTLKILVLRLDLNKKTGQTGNDGQKMLKKVPLKFLSNICRILEIRLINCEISLIQNWSAIVS